MIKHAYIHIPFCLRKCKYCSFVSGENIDNKGIYLNKLSEEIKTRYKGEVLKTLYIGGGTPSLLNGEDMYEIINAFIADKNAEITIEANPESVELKKFTEYKKAGINRVSIGIQTFNNDILSYIGRKHTSNQAVNAVETIKSAGFNNISIDLIYGLPNQSVKDFEEDIKSALSLGVQHISSYGLKIEEGSFFYENRPDKIPDDEMQAEMYNILCDKLIKYNHYEISNFGLEGFESGHNTAYWRNKEYYGFGLNASGYEGNLRYKNTSDFKKYIENPFYREEEILLTEQETMENEIFLALRLKEGININKINKKYNTDFMTKYNKIISKYVNLGLLKTENETVKLTRRGILLSNEIMSEFID